MRIMTPRKRDESEGNMDYSNNRQWTTRGTDSAQYLNSRARYHYREPKHGEGSKVEMQHCAAQHSRSYADLDQIAVQVGHHNEGEAESSEEHQKRRGDEEQAAQ